MSRESRKFTGIAVSPGLACGKACILGGAPVIPKRKVDIGDIQKELSRLTKAIEESKRQLQQIKAKVEKEMGPEEARVFEAHLLFLEDAYFYSQIEKKLIDKGITLEMAIEEVIRDSAELLKETRDPYLRERAQDIRDVGKRLLRNLLGYKRQSLLKGEKDIIIVAEELTPSDTVHLDKERIRGFVTEEGGITSHASILARSMGVPLVSGVIGFVRDLEMGETLLVDGFRGEVIRNPTRKEIAVFHRRIKDIEALAREEDRLAHLPAITLDGHKVDLLANIASEEDLSLALHSRAEGIGLYRTEIYFIDREDFPSEEEQFEIYRRVAEKLSPVTIRTLDLGGDKYHPVFPRPRELNPYLGYRAIRVSLEHPEIFKTQLRAILRASAFGKVRVMFPMIASLEEVKAAKRVLEEAKAELRKSNASYDERIQVGAMIEIPSAAIMAELILTEVDFLSVGTNDLIQYTLAVDRSNERVSRLYEPLNPAVLHLLKSLAEKAERAGKEISICGEMAGDPRYTLLLLGLGFSKLSMSSVFIPHIKKIIRSSTIKSARELATKALRLGEVEEIKKVLDQQGDFR